MMTICWRALGGVEDVQIVEDFMVGDTIAALHKSGKKVVSLRNGAGEIVMDEQQIETMFSG